MSLGSLHALPKKAGTSPLNPNPNANPGLILALYLTVHALPRKAITFSLEA